MFCSVFSSYNCTDYWISLGAFAPWLLFFFLSKTKKKILTSMQGTRNYQSEHKEDPQNHMCQQLYLYIHHDLSRVQVLWLPFQSLISLQYRTKETLGLGSVDFHFGKINQQFLFLNNCTNNVMLTTLTVLQIAKIARKVMTHQWK